MTDKYYPHDYLPLPLMEGYGLKPVSPLLRTELVTGRARQRRQYISTPTQATVKWTFKTDGESQLFEAWFRDVIKDGSLWFQMKLHTPLGLEYRKCRFVDIYEGPTLIPPKYFQFSATLELYERPILPVGFGEYPDLVVNSGLLDIAVNQEWPEA